MKIAFMWGVLLIGLTALNGAHSQAIYKCTTAKGVVYQDSPCVGGNETVPDLVDNTGGRPSARPPWADKPRQGEIAKKAEEERKAKAAAQAREQQAKDDLKQRAQAMVEAYFAEQAARQQQEQQYLKDRNACYATVGETADSIVAKRGKPSHLQNIISDTKERLAEWWYDDCVFTVKKREWYSFASDRVTSARPRGYDSFAETTHNSGGRSTKRDSAIPSCYDLAVLADTYGASAYQRRMFVEGARQRGECR